MTIIRRGPVHLQFCGATRRVLFTLGTEFLLQEYARPGAMLSAYIGEEAGADGKLRRKLAINLDNLSLYLWACLTSNPGGQGADPALTLERVDAELQDAASITAAFDAVDAAMKKYYGRAEEPERPAKRSKRKTKPWTWEDAFRLFCGEMRRGPEEFYSLLYCELTLILEGEMQRRKREYDAQRWNSALLASWMLQPHLKEGATLGPADLLGKGRKQRRPRNPARTQQQEFDAMWADIEARRARAEAEKHGE